jgi:hypothetical protein
VDAATGAIGGFQLQQTVFFRDGAAPLNGLAPDPAGVLGDAFDPEGLVVNPLTGTLLVSDEYGRRCTSSTATAGCCGGS